MSPKALTLESNILDYTNSPRFFFSLTTSEVTYCNLLRLQIEMVAKILKKEKKAKGTLKKDEHSVFITCDIDA